MKRVLLPLGIVGLVLLFILAGAWQGPVEGALTFAGGHETNPVDNGRPVKLIAAALGVEEQVFRDAFSGVTPAHGRGPSAAEARANKAVLMNALGQHGITNERLDEVSNHYRYRPQSGELWPHRKARARAVFQDGEVVRFEIMDAGQGYTTPPKVTLPGSPEIKIRAEIEFDRDFAMNGRLTRLELVD